MNILPEEREEAKQKAMIAFNSMREKAEKNGYMRDEEIEAEIAAARRECKGMEHGDENRL